MMQEESRASGQGNVPGVEFVLAPGETLQFGFVEGVNLVSEFGPWFGLQLVQGLS